MSVLDKVRNVWNVFRNQNVDHASMMPNGYAGWGGSGIRPDRLNLRTSNERSIIASLITRISIDVASLKIRHVVVDSKDRYIDDKDGGLNRCLSFEPNEDQGPRAFRQDIAVKMLDTGEACIVPTDVLRDRTTQEVVEIVSLRVGRVVEWFPQHVRVRLHNPENMRHEEIVLPKAFVALPDNPLYSVMNGPNSTLNRLIRKLNLLDVADERVGSNKLDLIIQLPYTVRSEVKRTQINERRKELEDQLTGSAHGIAWADATEKIIQLNRPVENGLLAQIQFLTKMLYAQLGLTEGVMDGSAEEKEMLNYYSRTVEPIAESIVEAMSKAFLGSEKYSNGERIRYYKDPFKFVPIAQFAEIADKFSRNEILTSNEIRGFLGIEPHDDPKADSLINSNINPTKTDRTVDIIDSTAEAVDEPPNS